MVSLAVPKFGQRRPTCFARPLLYRAHSALGRNDLIACGCLLREAVRRLAIAHCELYDCLPTKKQQRSTGLMLRILRKRKKCDGGSYHWLAESLKIGNAAAHCRYVKPAMLECSIAIVHSLLDSSENELHVPTREGGAV